MTPELPQLGAPDALRLAIDVRLRELWEAIEPLDPPTREVCASLMRCAYIEGVRDGAAGQLDAAIAAHAMPPPRRAADHPAAATPSKNVRLGRPGFDYPWPSRAAGWIFFCPRCSWHSPAMKHRLGAERHEREHLALCEGAEPVSP